MGVGRPSAHPRSRGENGLNEWECDDDTGSSPLTRGKHQNRRNRLPTLGLIPAHAGKTRAVTLTWTPGGAHPRSRGENETLTLRIGEREGSSPLTRGKLSVIGLVCEELGLIPAHAGKTHCSVLSVFGWAAHPRSRGENGGHVNDWSETAGSSPLTRGKLTCGYAQDVIRRLIPAHAGKTLPDLRFYCADRSDLGNP